MSNRPKEETKSVDLGEEPQAQAQEVPEPDVENNNQEPGEVN